MFKPTKRKQSESEAETKLRAEFNNLSEQWNEVLKPIVFPKGDIRSIDLPRWTRCNTPRFKIPIGPLLTMCAMYHWYGFLGRHLLREEFVELTNRVFIGIRIKDDAITEHIENPKDSVRKVLKYLSVENRHQLQLRCDRWFTDYLRTTPQAKARARHLLGL